MTGSVLVLVKDLWMVPGTLIAKEAVPLGAPECRGRRVSMMSCFVDADHEGHRAMRRTHYGVLIFERQEEEGMYAKKPTPMAAQMEEWTPWSRSWRYQPYKQFDTIRQLRTAVGKLWEASFMENSSVLALTDSERQRVTDFTQAPTSSRWFMRFIRDCCRLRMG